MRIDFMRRFAVAIGVGAAMLLAGCSSASKQLVGTWKGDLVPQTSSKSSDPKDSLGNALKGLLNGLLGLMTIEFNADGKYKASMSVASETGTYSVSGNEVTLTPDDKEASRKNKFDVGILVLGDDGKTLRSKKEFKSDADFVLKKQDQ